MSSRATALTIVGLVTVLVVVGGCSGAGVDAEEVRGGDVRAAATDHLSTVVLVASWLSLLYPEVALTGVDTAECGDWEMETLPDGTIHVWGTMSGDCSVFDRTMRPDGSGALERTWLDGKTFNQEWDPPVENGSVVSQACRDTYWDGTHLDYVLSTDISTPTFTPQVWDGTATLADGRRMDYVQTRVPEHDHLVLGLADGAALEFNVCLIPLRYQPDFAAGATGTFRSPAGVEHDFDMTGQGQRWTEWNFSSSDGKAGAFTLGDNMAGSGQIRDDGRTVAALRWTSAPQPDGTRDMAGVLDIVTARSSDITPSAAARDFQMDRWVKDVTELGATPHF
jgi:hypothetical protein